MLKPGDSADAFYTVFAGWAFRYRSLPSGQRQIVDFVLPGDVIGLHSSLNGTARHGYSSITSLLLCPHPIKPFVGGLREHSDLTLGLVQTLLLEEQRSERRLLLLGQQRATQRVSFLMLELLDRLRDRGLADGQACEFPLTYEQMMDALGLSRSQLARSLAEVRDRGWAAIGDGLLTVSAADQMRDFCGYESAPARPRRTLI